MTAPHENPPPRHALPEVPAAIPVLRTRRLTLRAPTLADFPVLRLIEDDLAQSDPKTGRDRLRSWADFMCMTATWVLRGHGWWTVEDDNGACGFVGLGFEPGDREPELGYLLAAPARGKGYATEAAAAARDAAWGRFGLPSLVSYVSEANTASQNVARKLGASRDDAAEAALGESGAQVWRHPRPEAA